MQGVSHCPSPVSVLSEVLRAASREASREAQERAEEANGRALRSTPLVRATPASTAESAVTRSNLRRAI